MQYHSAWVCTGTAWKILNTPWWEVQGERKRSLRAKTTPGKAGEISEEQKGEEEDG